MSYNNLNYVDPDELPFNVQGESEPGSSRAAKQHNGKVSYVKSSNGDWTNENSKKKCLRPKLCNCCCCLYILLGMGLLFCAIYLYLYFAYIQYLKEPIFTKVYFHILDASATENKYDNTLLFMGDGNVIVTTKNQFSMDITMSDLDLSIYFKDWINVTSEVVSVCATQDEPKAHLKAHSLSNVSLYAQSKAFPESVYYPIINIDLMANKGYVIPVGLRGSSTIDVSFISHTVFIDCLFNVNGTSFLNATKAQNSTGHPVLECPILNQTCDFSVKVF